MLRKLIWVGVFAGVCASVPVVYQSNPHLFGTLVRAAYRHAATQEEPANESATMARVEPSRETKVLLGRKVRIPANRYGHFRSTFELNGRPVEALIDTGATLVAINRSTARRIGLDLSLSDFEHVVNTANGETRAAAATIGSLQIGRIYVQDVQAAVLEDDALDTTLIGMTFLSRLSRYQVKNGELFLEQ